MIIGITGNSGSGKSYVVNNVSLPYKYFVIDADVVGHKILLQDNCKKEVLDFFGDEILVNGEISRKILGPIVFNDKEKLKKLTEITHKYIISNIQNTINNEKNKYDIIFVDAALLIESQLYKSCDYNILISSTLENKISRIVKRDNITLDLAKQRLSKQSDENFLKDKCTVVLENNYNNNILEDFKQVILDLFKNGV